MIARVAVELPGATASRALSSTNHLPANETVIAINNGMEYKYVNTNLSGSHELSFKQLNGFSGFNTAIKSTLRYSINSKWSTSQSC